MPPGGPRVAVADGRLLSLGGGVGRVVMPVGEREGGKWWGAGGGPAAAGVVAVDAWRWRGQPR